jgi:hypothetical protein
LVVVEMVLHQRLETQEALLEVILFFPQLRQQEAVQGVAVRQAPFSPVYWEVLVAVVQMEALEALELHRHLKAIQVEMEVVLRRMLALVAVAVQARLALLEHQPLAGRVGQDQHHQFQVRL